jgi:hypothetical protein
LRRFAAQRSHGDDTTVPVPAKGKTTTGRCWVYVRNDVPFAGCAPPAVMFYFTRPCGRTSSGASNYTGILQADAYGGYNKLYEADRKPGPILEAGCWVRALIVDRSLDLEQGVDALHRFKGEWRDQRRIFAFRLAAGVFC